MLRRYALAVCLILAAPRLSASIHIWTGAVSDHFSDAGNWSGGSPAGDANADVSFPAASRLSAQNDLAGLTIRSLNLSGASYVITGNPIAFTSDGQIIDSTAGPNRITCDLVLTQDLRITTTSDFGVKGLTLEGVISGTGALWVQGGGNLFFGGTQANTYAGITHVLNGSLLLQKPPHTNALPGELRIEMSNESAGVVTLADEQIPDGAPITIDAGGSLSAGGVETVGPLHLTGQAHLTTYVRSPPLSLNGTMILTSDITTVSHGSGNPDMSGNFVLPASRTFSLSGANYGITANALTGGSGAGVTFNGIPDSNGTNPGASVTGTWDGPTLVHDVWLQLANTHTAVTLQSGTFTGTAASLRADGGTVRSATSGGDIRLAPSVTVALDQVSDLSTPPIRLNGTLDLAGAQFTPPSAYVSAPRRLGQVFTLVSNSSATPVVGTFAGFPEGTIIGDRFRLSYVGGDGNDITVTEVGKLASSVSMYAAGSTSVTVGQSVSLTAVLYVNVLGPYQPSGSMTFTNGATVLATVPLVSSVVTADLVLPIGFDQVTATYSGTAEVSGSQTSIAITVSALPATVTSVDPTIVPGATTTTVSVRGSGFLDGAKVWVHENSFYTSGTFATTFISSTELQFQFAAPGLYADTDQSLVVIQPGPQVYSNAVTIHVTAVSPPPPPTPSPFIFGDQSVSLDVTPGAMTAWLVGTVGPYEQYLSVLQIDELLVSDDDHDGRVAIQYDHPVAPVGTWTAIDLSSSTVFAGHRPGNTIPTPLAFPQKAFLRDSHGDFSQAVVSAPFATGYWTFLWARPGVGAWRLSVVDGGLLDLDRTSNRTLVFNTSQMIPVGATSAPPAGIVAGDFFEAMDVGGYNWFGEKVDDHLTETGGPGTIGFASLGPSAQESDSVAHVVLLRRDGTDGAVTVQYATADDTAIAGTHYVAQAGVVTFNAGEIVKTIDLPLINDAIYSGNTQFTIQLSNPAGATIRGPASVSVHIVENELAPVISVRPQVTSMPEGDSGTHQILVDVLLVGATRKAASVNWSWNAGPVESNHFGQFVFAPGETQKTITMSYEANTVPELNRVFNFGISSPTDATLGISTGTVTVVDDDFSELSIADTSVVESAGNVYLRLLVSPPSKKPITFTYATADGTAKAGINYVAKTATISTSDSLFIPIVDNPVADGAKWFSVTISQAQGGRIGRSTAIVTMVDDEISLSAGPLGLSARATGPGEITVSWLPVLGATAYEVQTSSIGRPFATRLASFTFTSVPLTGFAADTTFLFRVRAIGANGTLSAFSVNEAATTVTYADDPLVPGVTVVKEIHLRQLRTAVNAMRLAAGLPPVDFTTSPIQAGSTIQAVHIAQLRSALDAARSIIGLPQMSYAYNLSAGSSVIRATDIEEIRAGCR